MSGASPGRARVIRLFLPLTRILLVGLVVVGCPVCCGVVKAEMLKGCSSPGSWQWLPYHPFWGLPLRNPTAAVTSTTAWFAIRDSGGLLGGNPEAHLFVGVQCRRRDECLFQASSTSVGHVVVHDYYVVQVGEVIPPT